MPRPWSSLTSPACSGRACETVTMRPSSFDTLKARNGLKGVQLRTTSADLSNCKLVHGVNHSFITPPKHSLMPEIVQVQFLSKWKCKSPGICQQGRSTWLGKQCTFSKNEVVPLVDKTTLGGQWLVGRILRAFSDNKSCVRTAVLGQDSDGTAPHSQRKVVSKKYAWT